MDLTKKHCIPCEGGVRPFTPKQSREYLRQARGWKLAGKKIQRDYKFRNFRKAMRFVGEVAALAEREQHHPDILIYSWNRVRLVTYTHAIGGLSENDFILAAKISKL